MFTTIEQVKELSGADCTQELIIMAQAMIESYIGKVEAVVEDGNDLMLLGRATAYQTAYLMGDMERVLGTVKAQQIMQYGNMVTYFDDGASPFIAPMAIIACKRLSWNRMRSVKTGSIWYHPPYESGWKTT